MSKKKWEILISGISLLVFAYSSYTDLQHPEQLSCDLRNRVVGSRLIHDGFSPYFYKWKGTDPVRYYDPLNFEHLKVSNITASPFFHHLIYPLAAMPQWKVSRWWCAIQYTLFLMLVLIALACCRTHPQKLWVLIFSTLFLLTDGWKMSINNGQYYILFPFLFVLIYFIFLKKRTPVWGTVAGLLSIILVLIRPNALLFFIPFVFLLKNYSRQWVLAFSIPIILLACWTLGDREERFLWQDYVKSLSEQTKFHQHLDPIRQENEKDPEIREWEGIYRDKYSVYRLIQPVHFKAENANVFYMIDLVFHWKMPVKVLLGSLLMIVLLLSGIYYHLNRTRGPGSLDLTRTAIFGFGLYMLSDIFSPVFRSQYYTVQVFFPILLAASVYRSSFKWVYWLLLAGVLLNISHIPFIKMEHTIGEYLIIGVIILFSLTKDQETAKEPKTFE